MSETIKTIKALLIEASESQRAIEPAIVVLKSNILDLNSRLKEQKYAKSALDMSVDNPRNHAKELALQYVLDGMDSNLLPRAMKVRYRKSYSYDDGTMLMWLVDNGYEDVLKIDTKKLKAVLDNRGTYDCPATEVEAAEIACDTDLKWITEDD